MAKKKRTVRTEKKATGPKEFFAGVITEQFSDLPEELIEQAIEILTSLVNKRNAKQEDVVAKLTENFAKTNENAEIHDRYSAAFISTRRFFKRNKKKPAEDIECLLIGMQDKLDNNGKRRILELTEEYDGLSDSKKPPFEIGLVEYMGIRKKAKKINDDGEKNTYLKSKLKGAYLVYDDRKKDKDGNDLTEDELGDDFFIESVHTWSTGSINFQYGTKLSDLPQQEFTVLVKEGKSWVRQGINVKGMDSIKILVDAKMFWPATVKVVTQKGTRWWNDQKADNFTITPMSEADALSFLSLKSMGEYDAKIFKMFKGAFEKAETTTIDKVNNWQRKRKSDKKPGKAMVVGIVDDITHWEDGGATISLVPQNVNIFDAFKSDVDDDDYDDMEQDEFRISVNEGLAETIDFDIDTKLYAYVDMYRSKKKDDKGNKTKEDADMPAANGWSFIADPALKSVKATPNDVSAKTFSTEAEEEVEEEEEEEFAIED